VEGLPSGGQDACQGYSGDPLVALCNGSITSALSAKVWAARVRTTTACIRNTVAVLNSVNDHIANGGGKGHKAHPPL
jgi:hypothetical protein